MADISKITLPNGSSYDIKDATARAGKQNIRNGTVSGNVNWDTLTTAGTYKIQNTTMTVDYNAPVGEYPYGILVVFDSDGGTEKRIMQIYFPHNPSKNYMYIRMRNSNVWTDWKGLSKDADTVDGKHASDFAAASHKQAYTSFECMDYTSDDNTMGTTPAAVKKAIGLFEPKSHTHTKSQITDFPTIPTKTSQLTNDSGFKTTDNNTTYSLSKSGSTITLTGSDGKTTSVTDSDTTYTLPAATSSTLGGVKIGSNITNSSGTISLTKANVTAALGYTPPTTNTTYDIATQSANGLMSSSDKTKLDGIATGANKTTVDSALSSTSTNPVQNKVINSALAGKAAASHTHTTQSAAATSDANASYLRQIATGTAEATTTNCPNGCLYGQYS